MKDLGRTEKELYDSPVSPSTQKSGKKKIYPEISLPLKLFSDMNLKVGGYITFLCKGRIIGIEDTRFSKRLSIEALKGEIKKTGKKGNSVLAEA